MLNLNDKTKENLQAYHILQSSALKNTVDVTPVTEMLHRHCQMALGGCSRVKKVLDNDSSKI